MPELFKRLLSVEEKIKNIVSLYTKIPIAEIGVQTVIDRSAVASSILLHRMYANLAAEGIVVENYFSIKTYGQMLASLNGKTTIALPQDPAPVNSLSTNPAAANSIGIDVEEISRMPLANDYREDEFYKMNFAPFEIAYCILQPDPAASFAGLFAAKEAIVKADNQYKNKPFHSIVIDHLLLPNESMIPIESSRFPLPTVLNHEVPTKLVSAKPECIYTLLAPVYDVCPCVASYTIVNKLFFPNGFPL